MKKRFLVLFLGLIAFPLALSAQTANAFQFVSFDIGYAPGWAFNPGTGRDSMRIPPMFALNVRMADSFTVGFQTYTSGTDLLPMFNMKYEFLPGKARGILAFGKEKNATGVYVDATGGATVGALGFEYIPFTRNLAGSVATEFKIGAQYLFDMTDASNGAAIFGIAFGIGI
jgi:hypothetical protein